MNTPSNPPPAGGTQPNTTAGTQTPVSGQNSSGAATASPAAAASSPSTPPAASSAVQSAPPMRKPGKLSNAFTTVLPLWIIVITVCLIALPHSMTANWFGLEKAPNANLPVAAPAVPGTSGAAATLDARSVSDIAKFAIDSSKDRADAMKETYDKLFSLFAALGALLAFLGFKGLDTFMVAKQRSEEIVQTANAAVERANAAYERAERATKDHEEFIRVRYAADNSAEINTAHGIVMREIAELYAVLFLLHDPAADISKNAKYRDYLDLGRLYLDKVTDKPENLNVKVVCRAFITRGNILRRQGDYQGALKMVQIVLDRYDEKDLAALFNAGCYCSLLAKAEEDLGNKKRCREHRQAALGYLKRAVELDPNLKEDAENDEDFQWLRTSDPTRFNELVK
ncbi:tetratricopeptide repeat protein [Paraburkholderia sp. BR10872]|uniref:tetratricopeptide repeat protein n=1 Tax=Paraburkholderia sp. BR10872 TaxID=3236989 RepID=UPI0034D2B207